MTELATSSIGEVRTISELCRVTSSKRIYRSEYSDDGVPFYRSREVIERFNGREVSTDLFISEERFEAIKSKFGAPEVGDLLLTSVGTLGIPYIVGADERFYFKDGNLTWFRCGNLLKARYLYYWLLSPQGKAELVKARIGSSQAAYTIQLLKKMEVACPRPAVQQRIADILSGYDELIENNNRRMTLLEEAIHLLYREWFVYLRFPGHERVEIVDGVPECWQLLSYHDFVEGTYGFAFKSRRFTPTDEGLPIVRIRNVLDGYSDTNTTEEADQRYLVEDGDLLIGMDGEFHMGIWSGGRSWLNQRVTRVRPREGFPTAFGWAALRQPISNFNHSIHGTTVAHLGDKHLKTIQVLVPGGPLRSLTIRVFGNLGRQYLLLRQQNSRLQDARDLLLPRLMDGRIPV